MAISPSGRSDVYWVDGRLQVGDDFWPPQKHTDKTYKLSRATTIIVKKDRVEIIHFNKSNELSVSNKVTIELNSKQLDCVKTVLDVVADEIKKIVTSKMKTVDLNTKSDPVNRPRNDYENLSLSVVQRIQG
ncbi:uncharacterized protein LOC130630724 isoform X2 [Hydractinia symbiolongicarpus]|uniref:uncharacterized protein LOC130630711 isoform X2 n=1 Tax=Hydractinia symbiolongicarpus TaxID=13093 RepID=UPI002550A8EC|nr:uncharacterized protein LOC130630711 isoform X2 [Hydractinia symbiolongicarpus]XP_057300295.1 uncharacterized protein LOC130630724 isoform X2 [Hydractinia symbiolongicarpus]